MTGTKKQKMNMSNAIVESIYSMEPPGRFLKQCPDTGEWNELSKREAADRVAQAMAYAIKGKDKLKQQRERRRSRSGSRQKSKDDVVEKSPQRDDRPTNNHLESLRSSSVARDGLAARGPGAAGSNNSESARNDDRSDLVANRMLLPDNSNLSQQLLQQLLQSSTSTSTALPTYSGAFRNTNQNGLVQALTQALQQQQQLQQQLKQQLLPLQYALGQDSLGGLQTQTPLQPALGAQTPLQPSLLEGLTQLLSQTQQQQQELLQQNEQQQLLIQRLLNQQTVFPSASLPPNLSLSTPFLTGPRLPPANSALSQNQVQLQSNPSNALLLNALSNLLHQPNSNNLDFGSSDAPQGAQQTDRVRRQPMLASYLRASSNTHLPLQQQQSQPFDRLLQQAALQLQQNSQGLPPTPINFSVSVSANATGQSTRQQGSEDSVQSGPEDDL